MLKLCAEMSERLNVLDSKSGKVKAFGGSNPPLCAKIKTNKKGNKMTNEEIKIEIDQIKNRNKKVETDKAWETSWTRKIFICILTYIVVVTYFHLINKINNVWLSSFVPVIGFTLSTISFWNSVPVYSFIFSSFSLHSSIILILEILFFLLASI